MRTVIAVVGCDGAGKSRLTTDLAAALAGDRAVEHVYLGQSSGNILAGIQRTPLIGEAIGRFLKRRSARAHANEGRRAAPDLPTALVVHLLSNWRLLKFRRVVEMDRGGTVVVTDRFPQAEEPGFYFDGPGLDPADTRGVVRWIARREQRLYRRMASHRPALVVRLNVDVDTAFARKPDHKLSMLRDKIRVIPGLTFGGAPILDLDGRAPYADVLRSALHTARSALGMGTERRRPAAVPFAGSASAVNPSAPGRDHVGLSELRNRTANDCLPTRETSG